MEEIKSIRISELKDFKNHHFHVQQDMELCALMKSIEDEGVIVPLLVRPNPDGEGYEVIAGHRRKAAALWAGLTEVPVVIRELDDNQAIVAMVDSNLQRENLKPSEKAFAYKMKLEAMNRQGRKADITSAQVGPKPERSNELLAKQVGESVAQIKRYKRNGMYLATKKIGKNNPKAAEIEADNKVRVQWNQTVDRALISGVAEKNILDVKQEKISEEVKHSIELYGNRPYFLADIIKLAIKALELLISKLLLAAAKVVEKVVDVVHEKVVENDALITEAEIKPEAKAQEVEQIQLPKKPEKSLLLSKYSGIMDLDAELKRRNDEIFRVEMKGNAAIWRLSCLNVAECSNRSERKSCRSRLLYWIEKQRR